MRAIALVLLVAGCASANPASSPTSGGEASRNGEAETASPPATEPEPRLSSVPECDAYLRGYRRCEPALAAEIAAGDRRDFEHERAWLEHLAGSSEGAGLPASCADMARELQARCP